MESTHLLTVSQLVADNLPQANFSPTHCTIAFRLECKEFTRHFSRIKLAPFGRSSTILNSENRMRDPCFTAFLNNHWLGMTVFLGIVIDLAVYP